jgi:hypothetical protein
MKAASCVPFVLAAIFSSGLLAQPGPSPILPSWIHSGLTLTYDALSTGKQGVRNVSVRSVVVTRVTGVSATAVSAITQTQVAGTPVTQTHAWSCSAAGACKTDGSGFQARFWVDPKSATTFKGANGEPLSVVGTGPYSYGGHSWTATTMHYQNPATGWEILVVFEAKTGVILADAETSPAQQVHLYFRSMQ